MQFNTFELKFHSLLCTVLGDVTLPSYHGISISAFPVFAG